MVHEDKDWEIQVSVLSEWSVEWTNNLAMHHIYIKAMYKAVMVIEWKVPLRASEDKDMHIICHFSAVMATGLYTPNTWRDSVTATGWKSM